MKPTIIAISGWKRSGKDTAAEFLINNFGFERIAFADPLKEMVSNLFGIYRSHIDGADTKEAALLNMPVVPKDGFSKTITTFMERELPLGYWTPRALCILIGSTMRSADPDYWVKKAVARTRPGGLYVISDCRYKNEIDALKRTGAKVISVRVNRFESSPSVDPSERDLDDYAFDRVIDNKTSLTDFYSQLEKLMEVVRG